jgi:hypothetical protein
MLGLSYRDWGKTQLENYLKADSMSTIAPNTDSIQQILGTNPSHQPEAYTGSFENKGYGIAKIYVESDTLWIDYNEAGERTKSYLEHYHYDIFRLRSTAEEEEIKTSTKISFQTNNRGDLASFKVSLEPSVDDLVFEKLDPVMEVGGLELQKYVGDYDLAGTTVKVYIRGESTLMVLVPGQPDYELVPSEPDLFKLKIADGYSVKFDLDTDGVVTKLSFLQPNGVFAAIKK